MTTTVKPGIYRRAFDWRLSGADRESMPNVAAALIGMSSAEWLDIFEDFLTISRKRFKNRLAMAKLQLHLVEEIMLAQATSKYYRKKRGELKAELAKPDGEHDQTQRDLEAVERELFLSRAYANCFRGIGDGIAWRALGHDRVALRALSGNAVKQQLLEQGTVEELHQWSYAFDSGKGFAILNALTN